MNFALTRKLIIFGLVLPLAAILGFTLATPQDKTTFLLIAAVTGLLLLPVMLKWYHPLLILVWNASINVFFLPGKPELWMLFTAIGFGIVVLNSTLDREKTFIHVPALTTPLLFFVMVVLVTAKLTGGMGLLSLGGGQIGGGAIGGKGYFMIFFAIAGYFVLTSRPIPLERAKTYVSMFLLSGTTSMCSNVAYMLGPAAYFLFYLFPVDLAVHQVMTESLTGGGVVRIPGLGFASSAAYFFMMARYGVRGVLDVSKPWRVLALLLIVSIGLFGGFRTVLATVGLHFIVQFCLEGLVRTRLFAFLLMAGLLAGAAAYPFIEKMPLSVQRCLAFVPGAKVHPLAKHDAEVSTWWRLEMWSVLLPEVPKYLIVGKGYALKPADLYLANQAVMRGMVKNYEVYLVSGAYHNGPLSVIIPFGIFGAIAVLWMMGAGVWALYRNYRYGDSKLQVVNTFLFAMFVVRIIVFFTLFGGIEGDIHRLLGPLGLSIAINRGVRKPVESLEEGPAEVALEPAPTPA